MKKLGIFGAGGHAKVVIEIAELNNVDNIYLYEDNKSRSSLFGYSILDNLSTEDSCIIAVGSNKSRKYISEKLKNTFIKLFHPNANISKRASLGTGTVVMAGASINSDVKIGKHCIINTNASIDHDCILSDFVHISPNVGLAGNVSIDEGTHIGIGANVIPNIKIGKWCIIGAGAIIISDVPDYSVIVGNPGRELKKNI